MTPSSKLLLFLFCLFFAFPAHSQNIYDEENSLKFATFLLESKQYQLASQEYERLVFMNPSNLSYKLSLLQSYRFAKSYDYAELRLKELFKDSLKKLNTPAATEYLKLKILRDKLNEAQMVLTNETLIDTSTRITYQEYIYLLSKNWKESKTYLQKNQWLDPRFTSLTNDAINIRYKSPLLASTLSTIIPGAGKVYAGFWKDGLIAFIFVAVNSWQAYRGFTKYGIDHAWIFGSIGTGFYLGNIYGSWKAAQKHNTKANNAIYIKAKDIIYSTF